jgi:hypothetical protein
MNNLLHHAKAPLSSHRVYLLVLWYLQCTVTLSLNSINRLIFVPEKYGLNYCVHFGSNSVSKGLNDDAIYLQCLPPSQVVYGIVSNVYILHKIIN